MVVNEVTVAREVLLAAAGELRVWSRHLRVPLIGPQHDTRMADGSCATCALIALLEDNAGPEMP